ncbi:MAG: glycosyltransferase [Pseudomonadota bacterium]|nr:glycosyltransferase [Pseudomonadota bacterium]
MFPKHGDNPYLRSLAGSLETRAVQVEDFTFSRALKQRYDVLHIHWPDLHLHTQSSLRAIAKHARLALLFAFLRLRGTRIVWTIHNLEPHERNARVGEWLFRIWFARLCTHVIALTDSGLLSALQRYPALSNKATAVIPHGHYRDAYGNPLPRAHCREQLGLEHRFTFLFFGNIRPYKNVPHLIEAFRALAREDVQLVIAGQPGKMMSSEELRRLAAGDSRIHLRLEFVAEDQVPLYIGASDVVVLPFRSILNSGSIFLALSFNRAVLAPRLGSLPEIQSHVGEHWVDLYDGALTTQHLLHAMSAGDPSEHETVDLSFYDWDSIGQRTLELYLTRTAQPGPTSPGGPVPVLPEAH